MAHAGGRPAIGPRRALTLPEEDWAWLDAVAAARGVGAQTVIRDLVAAARIAALTATVSKEETSGMD